MYLKGVKCVDWIQLTQALFIGGLLTTR